MHTTVGVEIAPTDSGAAPSDHPQQRPQYQKLQVDQDLSRDTTRLTVINPDMGKFVIMFQDPDDAEQFIASEEMFAGDTATNTQAAINQFYVNVTGASPVVTLACYNDLDIEVTCGVDGSYNAC